MHNPIYHYRLAKLYDSKGLKEQARVEYQSCSSTGRTPTPESPSLRTPKSASAWGPEHPAPFSAVGADRDPANTIGGLK